MKLLQALRLGGPLVAHVTSSCEFSCYLYSVFTQDTSMVVVVEASCQAIVEAPSAALELYS
jgi:hypothetical protein